MIMKVLRKVEVRYPSPLIGIIFSVMFALFWGFLLTLAWG